MPKYPKMFQNSKITKMSKPGLILQRRDKIKILNRNLVYIIGIPKKLADEKILIKESFLGQYGSIQKIIVNKENPYSSGHTPKPSYGAYVTFIKSFDAAITVIALNKFILDGYQIKASFGMTRYCTFFLKNEKCPKKKCSYIHKTASEKDCFISKRNNPMTMQREVLEFLSSQKFEIDLLKSRVNSEKLSISIFPELRSCYDQLRNFMKDLSNPFEGVILLKKKKRKARTTKKPSTKQLKS